MTLYSPHVHIFNFHAVSPRLHFWLTWRIFMKLHIRKSRAWLLALTIPSNIMEDGRIFETGPSLELLALYPKIMYSKTAQQNVQFLLTNN